MKRQSVEKQRGLTLLLFVIYVLALFWMVLFKLQFSIPVMEKGRVANLIPFVGSFDENGAFLFGEIRMNVLAFVPFGIYLCALNQSLPFVKKVLMAFFLSLGFEVAQFAFAIGRADITDVLSNTLGAVIGMGIYALLSLLLKSKTRNVVNALASACTILAILLVAVLLASHRWVRFQ